MVGEIYGHSDSAVWLPAVPLIIVYIKRMDRKTDRVVIRNHSS